MATKDPRSRNVKHHAIRREPVEVQWASPKQKEVYEYGPWPACASGGFGSAKTFAYCLKIIQLSEMFPNNRGFVARRVWEELKKTTMATFFKICPPEAYSNGGRRSDSEKILKFNNGSEVLWLHLDDPDTENVLRGLEINWFFIDQAEEVHEEIFDIALGRLGRWDMAQVPESIIAQNGGIDNWAWKNPVGKPIVPTYPMLACNPDTEYHWIYRRFHPDSTDHWENKHLNSDGGRVSYHDMGYRMWQMSSRENRFLPKQNLDAMLQQDTSFVRRFVDGQWGIPEGQIHTIDALSLIPGTNDIVEWIRQSCTLHRSMDHGDSAPTCCLWWGVDGSGNIFFFREYYQPNKLISDHRREVSALSVNERYQLNLADPSIFMPTMQKYGGRWAVSDEYGDCKNLKRETALFWQPADNNELGTRNRINEYLRVDPERIHPINKTKGSPRLFFITKTNEYPQGCYYVVKETRSQRRIKIGSEAGRPIFSDDRDDNIPDHAYDPLRYAIASRPPVAPSVAANIKSNTAKAVRDNYLKFKKRGGFRMMAQQRRQELKRAAAN
jgi:hypothetical protein